MPGPAPGQLCVVCNSPGIVLLNKGVNEGASDYRIAASFDLPRASVRRHRMKRHPGVTEAAATRGADLASLRRAAEEGREPRPPREEDDDWDTDGTPREQLEHLVAKLRGQAAGEGDVRPELAREIRLALEALEKMGSSEPPPVVRVADVDGLREMVRDMHEALKPWPEARAAMAEVWAARGVRPEEGQG